MPKISDLTAASALAAGHVFPVVQGSATRKATLTQVAEFMAANGYPSAGAMARTAVEHAFRRRFMGPDGTEQVRIEGTPLAVEFWRMGGAIAGAGPFMFAWSDTLADVPAVFGAKGKGSVLLANGAGPILEATEGGADKQVDAPLQVRGGATDWTTQPGLYVPANRKLWMGVAGKRVLEVRADSTGAGDTVALGFAVDATLAKIVAEGSNANVALYMQTKGTSNLTVGNSATGNIAFFQPASGGVAVAVLQFQAGPAGQPADILVNGNAGPLRLGVLGRTAIGGGFMRQGIAKRDDGTGFANFTLDNLTSAVMWHSTGTIAAAAVTMPASPADGQIVSFSTSVSITALTVSPNSGQTINGVLTTMTPSTPMTLIYNSTTARWLRV